MRAHEATQFLADLLNDGAGIEDVGVHELHDGDPVGVLDRQVLEGRLRHSALSQGRPEPAGMTRFRMD